jgi:hypothetical protein
MQGHSPCVVCLVCIILEGKITRRISINIGMGNTIGLSLFWSCHDLIIRNVVAERMIFFEDRLMRYLRAPVAGGWFDISVGQLRVLVFFSLYLYETMKRELFFNLPNG